MGRDRDKKRKAYCTGKTANGRPCGNPPIRGTTRCARHSYRRPGRPSKLTPDLIERIEDAVLEGNYLETAAQIAGIGKTTIYRWLRRGDEVEANALEHVGDVDDVALAELYDHVPPDQWVYLEFRNALKSAEAYAEAELLRQARAGGPGWQAPMTVLERRHPDRWRRRESRDVDFSGITDAPASQKVTPADEKRAAVAAILAHAGALEEPPAENTHDEEDHDGPHT